ncbi:MAG: DUF4266 domain-containing protein [Myxococcales bacterium]|nr:DUF4266 domain-containing protein [Myxococcales bacterium]
MRLIGLSVFLALTATGCATTHPWEREALSSDVMRMDGDEDEDALRHHVLSTREGTAGSLGGGGGGCGCN